MSNINKETLDDTIRKLDSIISSGARVTAYDRFILACLRELKATQEEQQDQPTSVSDTPAGFAALPPSICGEHCDHEVEAPALFDPAFEKVEGNRFEQLETLPDTTPED